MRLTTTRESRYPPSHYMSNLTFIRPFIFEDMELPGNTTTLLATGVVGIVEFLFTIPAVLWVDQIGRKKILIAGAAGMAICHFIVAGIIGAYQHDFGEHRAAGWTVIVFVWIFVINFAYSWGMYTLHLESKTTRDVNDFRRPRCMDCHVRSLPTQYARQGR